MQEEKIKEAIAKYINEVDWSWRLPSHVQPETIVSGIYSAIAPHLDEPKDYPYNELFNHMANEHNLTLTNTELGDIIHIARK